MMVVLEMATTAPAKTLSMTVQPKSRPTRKPSHAMMPDWITAVTPGRRSDAHQAWAD
jgi:hypothetical protein